MDQSYMKIKKGQQISMSIAQPGDSSDILDGMKLEVIDLRKDWNDILNTIHHHQYIQRAMEKAYQDFQEGHKLKDFKYRNGVMGAWVYADIHNGRYPCILTTTNWLYEYEKKEWQTQAKDLEKEAMTAIDEAIFKCRKLTGYADTLDSLEESQNRLYLKYPPRINQPETWRPQESAHWTSKWIKIMAETHYADLTNDWHIVFSQSHSIVAGFTTDNTAYLLDIILLTNNPTEIIDKLSG